MRRDTENQLTQLLDTIQQAPDLDVGQTMPTSYFQIRYQNHLDESVQRSKGVVDEYDFEIDGLQRDPRLDDRLQYQKSTKSADKSYRSMLEFRQKLPSYKMKEEILDTIEENQVVVISGETGCGKTTQVPQFILDSFIDQGNGSLCSVVCTQPRRISAISVAERVAQERAEECGSSVGFQIRLESKRPRNQGSILFCTTGIMLKWLESDQWLAKTSHIILDEVHERDVLSDFLLIILKDLLAQRPDLKLILMSATINADKFAKYYGGCPMITIPGFTFPVEDLYLEDILKETGYEVSQQLPSFQQKKKLAKQRRLENKRDEEIALMEPFYRNLKARGYPNWVTESLRNYNEEEIDCELIVTLIRHICEKKEPGAILVFLPGWQQISKVNGLLMDQRYFQSGMQLIIPLHSQMPTVNQKEIFNRPPPGVRKIILATNIAETSITIDDVVYVVDCGKVKIKNFDVECNMATLKPTWVSMANARQRRGRAGRVQPGICYHLFHSYRSELLEAYQLPEMLRIRLEELCLQIKLLKLGNIIPFLNKAMESPSLEAVQLSIAFLKILNALDEDENLTPLGFHLAHLPVDPQTGKMILFGAIFSCLDPITTVAASLSFKDAFYTPLGKEKEADERRRILAEGSKSDHIMLVNAFKGWEHAKRYGNEQQYCWRNFLSAMTLKLLSNMKSQLAEYLKDLGLVGVGNCKDPELNKNSNNERLVKAIVCAGLYPNVGRVTKPNKQVRRRSVTVATKDTHAALFPKSVNAFAGQFESPWIVFHQMIKSKQVYIYDTTMIGAYPLLFFGGKLVLKHEGEGTGIVVDEWIHFACPRSRAQLILDLRRELDKLLEYKITHPGPTVWSRDEKEGALLISMVDLLASEEAVQSCDGSQKQQPTYNHHFVKAMN